MRHAVIVVMAAVAAGCGRVDAPQLAPDTAASVDSGVGVTLDASAASVSDVATDVAAVVDGNLLPHDTVADVAVLDSTTGTPETRVEDSPDTAMSTEVAVGADVPLDASDDARLVDVDDAIDVEPVADALAADAEVGVSDALDDALDDGSVDDSADAARAATEGGGRVFVDLRNGPIEGNDVQAEEEGPELSLSSNPRSVPKATEVAAWQSGDSLLDEPLEVL